VPLPRDAHVCEYKIVILFNFYVNNSLTSLASKEQSQVGQGFILVLGVLHGFPICAGFPSVCFFLLLVFPSALVSLLDRNPVEIFFFTCYDSCPIDFHVKSLYFLF